MYSKLKKLKNAEEEVKRAYHKIVKLSPKEDLLRYVSGFMMLILDDSLFESLEEIMPTSLLMNTPYMLRLERVKKENYDLGLSKGLAEGKAEGKAEGEAEGKAKGLEEGRKMIRDNIIALSQRFDPSFKEATALQKQLQNLHDYSALSIALQKVARVDNFADFAIWLAEATEEEATTTPQNGIAENKG